MKKKVLSLITTLVVIFSFVGIMPKLEMKVEAKFTANEIVARADELYNLTWTPLKTIYGYGQNYTFEAGKTYHIPYGMPVKTQTFIGYNISVSDFIAETKNANSKLYTSSSGYNASGFANAWYCPYYAMDCSTFVSYCWGLSSRQTTSSIGNYATNLGACNSSNVGKIQIGDALNKSGHVKLVTGVSNGVYEITEETPGQLTRSTYTAAQLVANNSGYSILRYADSIGVADTQPPVIKEQYSHLLDANRFRVVCTPTDNVGVTSVKAATWTDEKQTDLVWRDCVYNGAGSWFMDIPFSEHHPSTAYVTHFYVYDAAGNLTTGGVGFSTSKPIISNVYITDMNTTGYTVHCTATDDYGISRVAFPTWTDKNGQDDLLWKDGQKSNSEYVFRVNTSDHKNETGTYITHIYAYDASGNETSYGIGLTVQNDTTKPVLSNLTISDISSKGYTVKCKATDNVGLSRVQFPTWTDKNGQDDIIWGFGGKNGDTYTYRVNVSAHNNETGKYHTHIYAFDYANNYSVITITSFTPQDSYRVTFNANGGSCETANKDVKNGSTYGTLPTPIRTGFTFTGWYTAKSGGTKITADTKVTITATQTLYAQWKANNYTVTFNANEGSCSTPSKSVTYAGTYGTLPTPTRTGYTFTGWYTAKSGGTKITADTKVTITAAQTLYAQWKANTYTRTLDAMGGKCDKTSITVTFGQKVGTLPTPTKTGYKFVGWFSKDGVEITSENVVGGASDSTFYAHWKAKGDFNKDDEVNVRDAAMFQRHLTSQEEFESENLLEADLNDDGKINVFDVIIMKRKLS